MTSVKSQMLGRQLDMQKSVKDQLDIDKISSLTQRPTKSLMD